MLSPKKKSGRVTYKETRHPVFHGVRLKPNTGKWTCELRIPNTPATIWLGTYLTAEMAARAVDVAEIAYRGERAMLNFADSWTRLPIPASADVDDVKKAAAEAAEAFAPKIITAPIYDVPTTSAIIELSEDDEPTTSAIIELSEDDEPTTSAVIELPEDDVPTTSAIIEWPEDEVPPSTSGSCIEYMDDDVFSSLESGIDEMAQGMVMAPPRWYELDSEVETEMTSLWSFPV